MAQQIFDALHPPELPPAAEPDGVDVHPNALL
jgi:hypothetical protein